MKTKSIVGLYYVMSALTSAGMGFFMGIYSNFLRSAGLDEFWVNMVNVCFFVVITICEIPTGLFADIFGRKGSFVISCFLETIAFAIYGFSRSFGLFVLAESIGAVGKTFASGAFEAWLVDSLDHNGQKPDLLKIFARRSLISRVSVIVASIVGGWIGDHGLNLPFFASSLTYAICGLVALTLMKENYFKRNKFSFIDSVKEMKETWNKSLSFAKVDVSFRFVLMISAVQMFAFMAPNMEWQKVFKDLGFSNSANGLIGGFINVAIIVGILMSNRFGKYLPGEKSKLIFTQVFTGACIVLTVSFVNIYPVLIFFFLHEVGRGASGPMMESYTQKCIPSSKERATLASFGSMVGHFGGALGLIVSGLIAKYAGIAPAWIVSGSLLILAILVLARNHKLKSC
jgi:MFS family permease